MAKTKIKYITFAPKVESTWNTPEEKQTEKARVIADASEKMVASLIARNKKSKTMDYRGIYYNGKLGLILVCKKLPDDAVATDYAQYVVKFDLDAATGGGTIDETTINNLIKKFLENNPIEDKDTKEYILEEDIFSTKTAFEKLNKLADKNGSFLNYGSVDDFEDAYPGLLTAYGVTLDTNDTLKMANYKVDYTYDKNTKQVVFTLKISGITSKGKMLTTTIKGTGLDTEVAQNITKVDQHLYDLGQPGTVQPSTPAKYVELDKLKTPKRIFESLDSLKTNGKYKTSGTINEEAKIKQIISQFNLEPFLGDMAGKDDSYTRITWDIEYSKPSDTDPITSELNVHVESKAGRRASVKIAYNNVLATQDDTTGKVVSGGLLPILIRPPFDPAFKGAFAPSNLRQMIKDYVVEEHEYPIELSGVVLDNRVMNDAKQYYTETNTAVVDPIALLYEIKIELTGASYFTGKVKLTWILENGKKVLLSGEYENASSGLATPGNDLQNRIIRVIEPVTGGGGTPTESKQIMDYKHTYYTSPTPLEVTTRFKDFVKTNTNTAYLEGTVVKKEDLATFAPLLNQIITEGDKDAVAMLYEVTYVKETGNAVTYSETMHFVLKDGRQVKVVRVHNNQSLNTPATTTSEIIPVGVNKEVKEKITELEKNILSLEEKLKKETHKSFEKRLDYIGVNNDVIITEKKLERDDLYKTNYFLNFTNNLLFPVLPQKRVSRQKVENEKLVLDTTKTTYLYYKNQTGMNHVTYANLLNADNDLSNKLYDTFYNDLKGVNNVYGKDSWEIAGTLPEVTFLFPKATGKKGKITRKGSFTSNEITIPSLIVQISYKGDLRLELSGPLQQYPPLQDILEKDHEYSSLTFGPKKEYSIKVRGKQQPKQEDGIVVSYIGEGPSQDVEPYGKICFAKVDFDTLEIYYAYLQHVFEQIIVNKELVAYYRIRPETIAFPHTFTAAGFYEDSFGLSSSHPVLHSLSTFNLDFPQDGKVGIGKLISDPFTGAISKNKFKALISTNSPKLKESGGPGGPGGDEEKWEYHSVEDVKKEQDVLDILWNTLKGNLLGDGGREVRLKGSNPSLSYVDKPEYSKEYSPELLISFDLNKDGTRLGEIKANQTLKIVKENSYYFIYGIGG